MMRDGIMLAQSLCEAAQTASSCSTIRTTTVHILGRISMKRFLIAAALLLLPLSGPLTLAQTGSTGSIAGTISDPTTAVVKGATITVKNNATNQEFSTTTTDNGTFNVPALVSGNYTVTITAQGFKTAVVPDVKVDVGTPSSVNVSLEIGVATETVQIVGVGGELIN